MLSAKRMFLKVFVDLGQKLPVVVALFPSRGKCLSTAWHSFFVARPYDTFVLARHGGKEVRSGLAIRADETEAFKVGFCIACFPEVDLVSVVQDRHFIEDLDLLISNSHVTLLFLRL